MKSIESNYHSKIKPWYIEIKNTYCSQAPPAEELPAVPPLPEDSQAPDVPPLPQQEEEEEFPEIPDLESEEMRDHKMMEAAKDLHETARQWESQVCF